MHVCIATRWHGYIYMRVFLHAAALAAMQQVVLLARLHSGMAAMRIYVYVRIMHDDTMMYIYMHTYVRVQVLVACT